MKENKLIILVSLEKLMAVGKRDLTQPTQRNWPQMPISKEGFLKMCNGNILNKHHMQFVRTLNMLCKSVLATNTSKFRAPYDILVTDSHMHKHRQQHYCHPSQLVIEISIRRKCSRLPLQCVFVYIFTSLPWSCICKLGV